MSVMNVRIDPETAAMLERVARERGMTKSQVVREALGAWREKNARESASRPYDRVAHLIGSWDSGGMNLSERTGQKFARLLKEKKHAKHSGRRRPARRAN